MKVRLLKLFLPWVLGVGSFFGVFFGLSAAFSSGASAPSSPPVVVCGNASLLTGPSSAPAGAITVPAGDNTAQLTGSTLPASTTYYFATGTHTLGTGQFNQIVPGNNDTFIGAPGAVLDGKGVNAYAFTQHATGVTIEYLTVQNFIAAQGESVVDHDAGVGWTVEFNTVQGTVKGAGVGIGSNGVVSDNCLTHNGEYGFNVYSPSGVSNVTLTNNEISFNNTTGLYDQSSGNSCGCAGGGKFWNTAGATVTGNYVHDNGDPGLWIDTDNSGFNISGNYISNNWGEGIFYEISYNAQIVNNTLVRNGIGKGPTNPGFPTAAIYISESGGDSRVAGYSSGSLVVSGNVLTDNWGGVVLWENSNRACGITDSPYCTLVAPATYTQASCSANLSEKTPTDYFDNCRWKTQNVTVNNNTFNFTPANIGSSCTPNNDCGFNGLFSEYGSDAPYTAWVVPKNISTAQHDVFSNNTYNGPWMFMPINQNDRATFAQWTAGYSDQNGSGITSTPQDAGSTFNGSTPPATTTTQPPATTTTTVPGTTTTTTTTPPANESVSCSGSYPVGQKTFTLNCSVAP